MFCADNVKGKIKYLFNGFYDSLMFSYFDGIYGRGYCDDTENPQTAVIESGDFYFVSGKIQSGDEIFKIIGENPYAVIVPDNEKWYDYLHNIDSRIIKVERFHTNPPKNNFNTEELHSRMKLIENHKGFQLEVIDEYYYNKALEHQWSESFVNNFKDYKDYSEHGFGYIITKDGEIVSGTSTYSYYNKGVEIEVATDEKFRLKGFAQITASAFLVECVKRNLTPHWDARNKTSLAIAEKMGFVFRDKYIAFEMSDEQ